jgi:hypothetical protein
MNIYKLNYLDKETAIADLLAKGVYVETTFNDVISLVYGEGIQAVVEIGKIVLTNGTYDENFVELTAPIFADGYHYDIMCKQDIDFGLNEIQVNNLKHSFAGYTQDTDGPVNIPLSVIVP